MNDPSDDDADTATGTRFRYDWSTADQPSVAVVESVAEATDQGPTDLRPLADVVDTDALDRLLTRNAGDASLVHTTFQYESVTVTVDSSGFVRVEPRHE